MYHVPLFKNTCDLVNVHAFEQLSNYIKKKHTHTHPPTPFKKTSLTTIKFNFFLKIV